MRNLPSPTERGTAALVQGLATVCLFIPAWITVQSKAARRSAYVSYWTRVSLIWSVLAAVLILGTVLLGFWLPTGGVLVLIVVIHVVLCVMGAFASSFNIPFGYVFVASLFCPEEYESLRRSALVARYRNDD